MMDPETVFLQIAPGGARYTMVSVLIPRRVWSAISADAAPGTWKGRTIDAEATPQIVQGKYLNLPITLASQISVVK
jgi:hypothetical protein